MNTRHYLTLTKRMINYPIGEVGTNYVSLLNTRHSEDN